jgi:hypothetical protein
VQVKEIRSPVSAVFPVFSGIPDNRVQITACLFILRLTGIPKEVPGLDGFGSCFPGSTRQESQLEIQLCA